MSIKYTIQQTIFSHQLYFLICINLYYYKDNVQFVLRNDKKLTSMPFPLRSIFIPASEYAYTYNMALKTNVGCKCLWLQVYYYAQNQNLQSTYLFRNIKLFAEVFLLAKFESSDDWLPNLISEKEIAILVVLLAFFYFKGF